MITKFERKVIAGLTAFLMCLSMIFAVPVSVNAEAERTQDEAVSGVCFLCWVFLIGEEWLKMGVCEH